MMRMAFALTTLAAAILTSTAQAQTQTVYTNNFDAPATIASGVTATGFTNGGMQGTTAGPWNAAGWSGNTFANSSGGNPAAMSVLTLSGLANHTSVDIDFLVGFMDSWDSTDGSCCGPDYLEIFIDGTLVGSMTTNNTLGSIEDYDGGNELYDSVQLGGNFSWVDTLVDMSGAPALNFAHTVSTLTFGIRASGNGWQGGSDESWAIDSLSVTLNGVTAPVPEPATWAMMIGGFGMVGGAMRSTRRKQKAALTAA